MQTFSKYLDSIICTISHDCWTNYWNFMFFQKDVCWCVELREKGSYETCLSEQARIW